MHRRGDAGSTDRSALIRAHNHRIVAAINRRPIICVASQHRVIPTSCAPALEILSLVITSMVLSSMHRNCFCGRHSKAARCNGQGVAKETKAVAGCLRGTSRAAPSARRGDRTRGKQCHAANVENPCRHAWSANRRPSSQALGPRKFETRKTAVSISYEKIMFSAPSNLRECASSLVVQGDEILSRAAPRHQYTQALARQF
jgi:hypothetical protein